MSVLRKNIVVQSGVLLMFLSAFLHMCILGLHFFVTLDVVPFNFFKIIGLDFFFPNFVSSTFGNFSASIVVIVLYFAIYFLIRSSDKRISFK